jgi:thioredoxin reductase (NADPH)
MDRRALRHGHVAVIEEQPARLVEVPGLGPKRTAKITAAWAEQKAIKADHETAADACSQCLRAGGPNGAAWCLGGLIRVIARRSTGRRCSAQSVSQGTGALESAGVPSHVAVSGPRYSRSLRREVDMPQPVFLVVSESREVREELAADLRRRFAADYRVVGVASPTAALTTLADLARVWEDVTLLIADERLTEMGAVDFLVRAHELHPAAKRVLLVERGDWSSTHPAISAMALGQIDYHLYNPWRPLERILYATVSEFLAAWERFREPMAVAFRIVGAEHSRRSHQLRDVLTRSGVPYWFFEPDSAEGRTLLREVGLDSSRLPVVVHFDGTVLIDPSYPDIVAKLGLQTRPNVDTCDVAIIGAGPAGLAAAVYAASEGLSTLVLEPVVPGGQAGTSSLIRNYLGFPRGLSGEDLTNRALEQAWLFGSRLVVSQSATRLTARGSARVVRTTDGSEVTARTVVLATGVTWRRLGLPTLEALIGAGVFYGAAAAEARATSGRDVFVVGAGNSAGQAAIHLAKYAACVTMVVRGADLTSTMSDYLVTEISKTPNIDVRLRTEIFDGNGRTHLETLTLRNRDSDAIEVTPAAALFLMIGAEPHTQWLGDRIERDDHGFILTGRDLHRARALPTGWPLGRSPFLLETSLPGVFAAGDVRHGSTKRVASAVGEGAVAVQLVHEYLREQ